MNTLWGVTGVGVHVDLDGSGRGAGEQLGLETVDARSWGPRLRYLCSARDVDAFEREVLGGGAAQRLGPSAAMPRFVLSGSGDFHHLAGLWLRRALAASGASDERTKGAVRTAGAAQGGTEGVTVYSFDNHPDWDVRPPRWACGGWLKVALGLERVSRVSVWGCGNFEMAWPGRWWRVRDERMEVRPWRERLSVRDAATERYRALTRAAGPSGDSRGGPDGATGGKASSANWRREWERECGAADVAAGPARDCGARDGGTQSARRRRVYVTIDLDCLAPGEATTNWEQGLFTVDDLVWALGRLHESAEVIGGDICGAYSRPSAAGLLRRLAMWWDHPQLGPVDEERAREVNSRAILRLWPALTGSGML